MSDKKYVTYEDFGAVGDGVADDFAAIYRAHEYANENHLPVRANDGATYYINRPIVDGEIKEIIVKTPTNWGEAHFVIDDREISAFKKDESYAWHSKQIFKVMPYAPMERIEDEETLKAVVAGGLKRGATRVALKLGYPALIMPYNNLEKIYKRRGYGAWMGKTMHEVIVIDGEGNISEETPIMFEYNHIDYIEVIRLDIEPMTIEGGIFTTRASRCNMLYKDENGETKRTDMYVFRGLNVRRSFTTVKNVKHYITDEITLAEQVNEKGEIIAIGPCYYGFFSACSANHVTFEDCILTGRRCYRRPNGGTGGTYDLSGDNVNKIVFKRCIQSNFWVTVDKDLKIHPANRDDEGALASMTGYTVNGTTLMMHWGLGGTNFCKNMEYIDSRLSRFDAHEGLYHGKIINSEINGMEIVGVGNLYLENSTWYSQGGGLMSGPRNALFYLRDDYASTWDGELTVKNFNIYATINESKRAFLFCHSYSNWDYGYQARFPNLHVENLRYFDFDTKKPMGEGTRIYLVGSSIDREPWIHREYTKNSPAIFPDVDEDGDGLVDGTNIPYDDVIDIRGVTDSSNMKNINPIIPPAYIRILGNKDVGYNYIVHDTSEYDDGGFFGTTRFETDENCYTGTAYSDTETFKFEIIKYED